MKDTGQALMRVARFAVRRWERHPEYEDMLAEAYAEAWIGYQQGLKKTDVKPLTVASRRAGYAPIKWLRRLYGRPGYSPLKQAAEFVPLDEDICPPVPDFAGELVERLDRERLVARISDRCWARQWDLLERLFYRGQTQTEVARERGCSLSAVNQQWRRLQARCREEVPEC